MPASQTHGLTILSDALSSGREKHSPSGLCQNARTEVIGSELCSGPTAQGKMGCRNTDRSHNRHRSNKERTLSWEYKYVEIPSSLRVWSAKHSQVSLNTYVSSNTFLRSPSNLHIHKQSCWLTPVNMGKQSKPMAAGGSEGTSTSNQANQGSSKSTDQEQAYTERFIFISLQVKSNSQS